MRNISFFLTQAQVRARTKTVTRRTGWENLKAGTLLRGIVKGQGLKAGEKVQQLCTIRVKAATQEPLTALLADPAYGKAEAAKEGFPEWDGAQFVAFICKESPGVFPERVLTRIEFEYVEAES